MNLMRLLVKSDLRVFGLVFAEIFLVAVIHTVRQPRMYKASGTVKFHSYDDEGSHHSGAGMGDWNKMRLALKSPELIQSISSRFTDADRAGVLAPYDRARAQTEAVIIEQLIRENQRVSFDRLDRALAVQYQHPDRQVAARIVNLLIDEVIAYQARKRIDEAMKAVEELKVHAEARDRRVRELTEEMAAYREQSKRTMRRPFDLDVPYQALEQKQMDAQKILDALIRRMRDTTMICGPTPTFWRVTQRAVPPSEGDYLIAPVFTRLAWGGVLAVVGSLLAVGIVNIFARGRE